MAVDPAALLVAALPELRAHPTVARVRAYAGGRAVVDSVRALVVWEPRRVVPCFAVPRADVDADLVPYDGPPAAEQAVPIAVPTGDTTPVLDPRTPFTAHSCPGRAWTLRFDGRELPGAGFTPDDPDLADHVLLDWSAFEEWREEEEVVVGHPHDPFDRIDCRRSSRHVVITCDGTVLADTRRAVLLMETPLPLRFYVPAEDVDQRLLVPSTSHTVCAYKGTATYWSARVGGRELPDLVWTYREPLHDALPVKDLLGFFTERVDLRIDDEDVPRPVTPWS
jgi:uncharacterized protein (DUF427 family)